MFTPPSELLVAQPVSNSTRRLLGTFSQAVQGLKAEYVDGNKYATETAEATLQAFYASGEGLSRQTAFLAEISEIRRRCLLSISLLEKPLQLVAIASATVQLIVWLAGSSMDQKATDLAALETLPPLVMQALAHALDYLKQFQLEAIVQQKSAFKPFSEADELSLSPNALQ